VLYGGDELLAEGTVLDLTQIGWRIAGAMPVRPGMQLALAVWVPEKREPLRVERATVLWVNGCEFAIEAHEMAPCDQTWVSDFLSQKLGLSWISRAGDQAQTRRNSDLDPLDDGGRAAYDRAVEETWGPAFHIVRGMIANRAARERTGRDSIADN
jgi:hypothetical protein